MTRPTREQTRGLLEQARIHGGPAGVVEEILLAAIYGEEVKDEPPSPVLELELLENVLERFGFERVSNPAGAWRSPLESLMGGRVVGSLGATAASAITTAISDSERKVAIATDMWSAASKRAKEAEEEAREVNAVARALRGNIEAIVRLLDGRTDSEPLEWNSERVLKRLRRLIEERDAAKRDAAAWRRRCFAACDGHVDVDALDAMATEQEAARAAERSEP